MLAVADAALSGFFRLLPSRPMTAQERAGCRIVAHRGHWSHSRTIHENTLEAFAAAVKCGAWGIELDVQWTLDRVPVVIHDLHTAAVPGGVAMEVGQVRFDEIRRWCPLVPTVEEVVLQFGRRIHLMLELKKETASVSAVRGLVSMLNGLEPTGDFHLMALEPELLLYDHMLPPECRLLVATLDTRKKFRQALEYEVGGLTGHFFLLNSPMRRELNARNLKWGTGFIDSENLMSREVRAGAEWIFTDYPQLLGSPS